MRRTELYRVMPWVGGKNTSVDPGVLGSQELVDADNVQFSSTGARVKREAFQYLDQDIPDPDFRSSSGTTRTLIWTSSPIIISDPSNYKLVLGEHIRIVDTPNYNTNESAITSVSSAAEVTTVLCVGDTAGSLAGKYFLISGGDDGIGYYVWYKVSGVGTDPEVTGRIGVEVDVSTNNTASQVATATQLVINAMDDFNASVSTTTVTITAGEAGYTVDPANGTSGFTTTVTTQGSYTLTYEVEDSFSESLTAAGGLTVARASMVIAGIDYWRFSDDQTNEQELVYATSDFQLFKLDASGRRSQILGQEQTTLVTTNAASTLTTGDYFTIDGSNEVGNAYVWYNKDGGGGNPLISGRTGIEVVTTTGDTAAQVATATQAAIDPDPFFSATVDDDVVTIVAASSGITNVALDVNTGFTIVTSAYGATTPTDDVDRIRMLVYNERLQIYFSGLGNFPVAYNPDESPKYQLIGENRASGLTMPDASFAFVHLNRVWANDKERRDYIHYSETGDETLWLGVGDSGALLLAPGDGDPQGITNGYVYKGFAMIGKKDARFRVQGDSPENFFVERVSQGLGNEGPLAVAVDEEDVVFVSRRGVHSQQTTDRYGDTDAAYLSADVKPSFNDFEPERLDDIQGAYIPELNSVALSIAEDGDQEPNNIWLFNFEAQVPGKDRPGAWYRWPDQSCTALFRRFVVGKHKLVFGTVDGRIVQAQKENDYSDFGTTGIPFRIKTGTIYPGNDPQSMKAFKRITMIYRPRGNFSFAVQAKVDNLESQGFAFNELSGLDLLGETFILGTSILGSSNTLAPFTFTMEGYGRGVTLTITQPTADEQIEIWGFAIEFENLDLEQEVQ